jgi:fucose 4-O-acetylase-like acetyltransferase
MKSERLHYLDIAKGILILLVVIHHLPHVMFHINPNAPEAYLQLQSSDIIYKPFFMPAFFVITGMCLKLNISFKDYLIKNAKSILLPAFCLGFLSNWISLFAKGETHILEYCKLGFSTFLYDGGKYWFLSALFISKLIYYWANRLNLNRKLYPILMLLLLFIGVLLNHFFADKLPWHFAHALALTPFLYIGYLLKKHLSEIDKFLYASIPFYIIILAIALFSDRQIPYITAGFNLNLMSIPPFLLLAIIGSIAVLQISKIISQSPILEFFGRNSLVIYGLHVDIFSAIFYSFISYFAFFNPWVGIFVSFFLSMALCSLGIYLLNLPFLRCLIGKF